MYVYYPKVISEVVLTKGWTEPAPEENTPAVSSKQNVPSAKSVNGARYTPSKAMRGLRNVKVMPKKQEVQYVKARYLSKAEVEANRRAAIERNSKVRK